MAESQPRSKHPQKADEEAIEASKNERPSKKPQFSTKKRERLMYQDETGSGRINRSRQV